MIFNTKVLIILTAVGILLKTILLYKSVILTSIKLELKDVYMLLAFIGIILAIPMCFRRKARFWTTIIVSFLLSLLMFINELYYSYATNLVSVSQISNLQYGREISAALPSLLKLKHILYFIDIVLILIVVICNKNKIQEKNDTKKINWKRHCILVIVYIVCCTVLFTTTITTWIENAKEYQYNKIQQIREASILGYHFIDIVNNSNIKKNAKYKTKTAMMAEYNQLKEQYETKYKLQYNYAGIAKDKNVIILQLESIQNFLVNAKINGKEITPNLNKFIKENIRFTNMQNQSYSSTADSEYSVMNSLYPLENGMSFAQYSSNDYNDLYSNFKRENYITTYIHGNEGGFWNRFSVYSRLQIDNLLFDDIFDENVERINNYVSDEEVYRKIVSEMNKYEDKFLVNIIASSSHIGFDLPGIRNKEEKVNIDVGDKYRGTLFGNYLEAANYADYAFGIFIDELQKSNLYEDTVILVYGDHAGMPMYNEEMMSFLNVNEIQTQINYSNVLCSLKIPGVEANIINKPVSKLDVKPTLCEICGIEDGFSLGQSMFSNKDFVCLNNARIITDKYFYNGKWYVINTSEEVDMESLSEEEKNKLNEYYNSLNRELDISLSINVLNLLKK